MQVWTHLNLRVLEVSKVCACSVLDRPEVSCIHGCQLLAQPIPGSVWGLSASQCQGCCDPPLSRNPPLVSLQCPQRCPDPSPDCPPASLVWQCIPTMKREAVSSCMETSESSDKRSRVKAETAEGEHEQSATATLDDLVEDAGSNHLDCVLKCYVCKHKEDVTLFTRKDVDTYLGTNACSCSECRHQLAIDLSEIEWQQAPEWYWKTAQAEQLRPTHWLGTQYVCWQNFRVDITDGEMAFKHCHRVMQQIRLFGVQKKMYFCVSDRTPSSMLFGWRESAPLGNLWHKLQVLFAGPPDELIRLHLWIGRILKEFGWSHLTHDVQMFSHKSAFSFLYLCSGSATRWTD